MTRRAFITLLVQQHGRLRRGRKSPARYYLSRCDRALLR